MKPLLFSNRDFQHVLVQTTAGISHDDTQLIACSISPSHQECQWYSQAGYTSQCYPHNIIICKQACK